MAERLQTISPVDGSVVVERPLASADQVRDTVATARAAYRTWRATPLAERATLISRAVDSMVMAAADLAPEITLQMGRPIAHAPGELSGFEARARYMIAIAEDSLADIDPGPKPDFRRFIRREPLGVVFIISPWNYPYLTAVNSVVPALLAGNVVVLKHSHQTPLAAERLAAAMAAAGLPDGVFQYLHMSHADVERTVASPGVDFVAFTGSTDGGRQLLGMARQRLVGLGMELGGKDPAYVRPDAAFDATVASLVEGVFFNAGQSCCAVERLYVHADLYDRFVEAFVAGTRSLRLGDPRDADVTLGPMVRTSAADRVREKVRQAVAFGAKTLIDPAAFPAARSGTPYLAPQVLIDVDHTMTLMTEETFGPAVGIMKVDSDDEAIRLMNDSPYGLSASVWTADTDAALRIGAAIETGTFYQNRCDYLDPALAWVGVKDSGRGCTLSRVGFEALTRPKSFHLRTAFPARP